MSTLAMLKAEGREEGKIEGKIEGKAFKSVENLLTILLLFPEMEIDKISLLTKFEPVQIKKFKETLVTKKSQAVKNFIDKKFLAEITLTEEEQKEINLLTKRLLTSKKK